ncbi:hypothetical protein PFISCL1PPCAC_9819, partial [Pristionchus fissidentatus]
PRFHFVDMSAKKYFDNSVRNQIQDGIRNFHCLIIDDYDIETSDEMRKKMRNLIEKSDLEHIFFLFVHSIDHFEITESVSHEKNKRTKGEKRKERGGLPNHSPVLIEAVNERIGETTDVNLFIESHHIAHNLR